MPAIDRRALPALAGAALSLWLAAPLGATDVAFWSEYRPAPHDAEQTYLLLQLNELPLTALGSIQRVELVDSPTLVDEGRFGKALRLDGRSALRCVADEVFEGGRVSIEAWLKLDCYPEREGCIVFRPALVDRHAAYDPEQDRSRGFGLLVDSRGALHLETVNTFYGRRTRTSTGPEAVPLGRWVHVAGICGPGRRLFVDGSELVNRPIDWGEGLVVSGEQEQEPQALYVGNNDRGDAGITGLLDQVRVHRNVHRFWAPEDDSWTDPGRSRPLVEGPEFFVPEHSPVVRIPLDSAPVAAGSGEAAVELGGADFRAGVRGRAFAGRVAIMGEDLFTSREGSLEFWLRPLGVNSLSDRNWSFVNEPFVYYLFNGGEHQPTLYFRHRDGALHFVHAPMEIHPARWFHFVITWRGSDIRIYSDGKLAGHTTTRALMPGGRSSAGRFVLNGGSDPSLLDEIRVYDRALLPVEAANAFWRYRDPTKLVHGVRLPSVELVGEYLPSERNFHYRLLPFGSTDGFSGQRMELRARGAVLESWDRPWDGTMTGALELPELEDGKHTISITITDRSGESIPGMDFRFYARRFEWEGNDLGLTGEIFQPFVPVEVRGARVYVVSRSMTLNGFGLWDSVESLGRDLLAGPMTLRFETPSGEGAWDRTTGCFTHREPGKVVFEGSAESGPVSIRSRSSVEVDGCMQVEMTIAPGRAPSRILKLWLEIPLVDTEVPLMHTIGDGLRHNYSGSAPAGEGVVWDGSRVERREAWRNAFVPHIWLGSAVRGMAFFAENDRGWVTEKHRSKTPTHELIRRGGRLTLRVYFINRPVTLSQPRELVFGLQASPTKPMPPDWRRKLPHAPGGLAVVPWGGIQCASQGPFRDDWTIVEKILEARRGEEFDVSWLSEYARRFEPPRVHDASDWTFYQKHFAQRAKSAGMARPLAVYQEEMRAAHSRPEWIVYQDEWKATDGPAARTPSDGLDLSGGHRSFSSTSQITFVRSYADFGTWMANEWLQRGVSLYWDNTYLYPSYNTRTTAAYRTEDGNIQPALIIWNVRRYHQRVWNLLQHWRRRREEPLEWTLHMTNTEPLPVQTWGTVQLDHELSVRRPFSPEWLMTESIGRQVGNLPLSLYEVYGRDNELVRGLPEGQRARVEWGLRAVHEIQRTGPLEEILSRFGYGEEGVSVHNYWDDWPVLEVAPDSVKWLALSRADSGEMLCVLASWAERPVTAEVQWKHGNAGPADAAAWHVLDAESREVLAPSGGSSFSVGIAGPYGNRILLRTRTRTP